MRFRHAAFALSLLAAAAAQGRERRKPAACPTVCTAPGLYRSEPKLVPVDRELISVVCPAPPEDRIAARDVTAFFVRQLGDERLASAAALIAPKADTDATRARRLTAIWGKHGAFGHVLCGDHWKGRTLGGLHLEARYAQLEREGKLCYGGPARRNRDPCDKGLCSIRFRATRAAGCAEKPKGSFLQGADAIDLLAAGTRAYAACCKGRRRGGLFAGPGGATFEIACQGGRDKAIATFFPAGFARPTCGP
jgi:hypothetical protein